MLKFTRIRDRWIVVKGVGKMYYQEGFPMSMGIDICRKKGYEVSILHIADELLKGTNWPEETVIRKIKDDFSDDPNHNSYDHELLTKFVHASYEDQREMIFQYLFGVTSDNVRNGMDTYPLEWVDSVIKDYIKWEEGQSKS